MVVLLLYSCSLRVVWGGDPDRPIYRKQWVAFRQDAMPQSTAIEICGALAQREEIIAEREVAQEYSTPRLACRPTMLGGMECENRRTFGGTWGGILQALTGEQARRAEMISCMADRGYQEQRMCVRNC